jgi:hypothetical protein
MYNRCLELAEHGNGPMQIRVLAEGKNTSELLENMLLD